MTFLKVKMTRRTDHRQASYKKFMFDIYKKKEMSRCVRSHSTRKKKTRTSRFGDNNGQTTTTSKLKRQDTPHMSGLTALGYFDLPPTNREDAERLGYLEAVYARDLTTPTHGGEGDEGLLKKLENRYKGLRRSVFTPESRYLESEDLEGMAKTDLNATVAETGRRAAARATEAEHQTLLYKIRTSFNKLFGRNNAFGKTSKKTGRKKKYTKKARNGFQGYHNPDF